MNKKKIKKSVFIIIYLLSILNVFAIPKPPPPIWKKPPPPPGLPIDKGVYLMLIMAVILGLFYVYRYNLKKIK